MKSFRWLFLSAGIAAWALVGCATSEPTGGSTDDLPLPDSPVITVPPLAPVGANRLRLLAGNLTSGNKQAYETAGIHIFRGLAPDVAMIQEFNVASNSTADLRGFVDQAFGTDYSFARGAASEQIPNGIISRYPIIASGEWADSTVGNRAYTWAQIDIPGPVDLYAISVHLLSSSSGSRNTEAGQLVQRIHSLPAGAYVVLGGDFNTTSRSEACVQTLGSVLRTGGPFPVDEAGLGNTNANRNKPYDWVLANGDLQALQTDTVVGSHTFTNGLVADTRVYSPISEIAPAVAADSGASNMQHMAVVRDFALPGAPPPPPPPPATVLVTSPNGGDSWAAGSSQTITWTSTSVDSVSVELSTDGATFITLSAATPAADGQLIITAPSIATTSARVRVSAAPGGTPSDVSDAAFTITVAPPPPPPPPPPPDGKVFINEVLANEPGSDTAGEFVELVNSGGTAVDLTGWTISDSTAVRHVFASGTTLGAGRAIVVFAGASAIPAGLGNAIASSTGSFTFGNSGDSVKLASPAGLVDSLTYTSALSGTDGVSMNRSPDGSATGTFVLHTALSSAPRSAGTRSDGTAF